jgi:hypothetical protein
LVVHGATSRGWLSPRGRALSGAGIGVLTGFAGPGLVDEVLAEAGAREQRVRAVPSRLGVYFVLGLCLFSHLPYGQVLREITAGARGRLAAAGWRVPATTTLSAARRRVGEQPLQILFGRLCGALAPGRSPWSHICGLLAVAWDGTTVAAPASSENIAAFGQIRGSHGGHYPHLRLVTLIACGTRALLDARHGPSRGKGTGEQALARELLRSLHAGMLLLADRNFYSYQLWAAAAGTGAELLWRVKASLRLNVTRILPDGSFLATINDPRAVARRLARNGTRRRRHSPLPPDTSPLPGGITVRVITFTLTTTTSDGRHRTATCRLITTLLDWHTYPATALASGYAWRWAIETSYREFKTILRGPGRILRGRTPELARQELWAWLIIYQALRIIITSAAATAGIDPGQISFTATLHAARRTLHTPGHNPAATLTHVHHEILTTLNPRRTARTCIRAVYKTRTPFPSKASHHGPPAQHVTYTTTITTPRNTTPQQPQPNPRTATQPP